MEKEAEMINWKKAFTKLLEIGGVISEQDECVFCQMIHDEGCNACVAHSNITYDGACGRFWNKYTDNSERRAICRHVLATVKDFTDRDEIRARIAEMLDDDAREKFLGEAEKRVIYTAYDASLGLVYQAVCGAVDEHTPAFKFTIQGKFGHIAAFRDEETRDRVLRFLNEENQTEEK